MTTSSQIPHDECLPRWLHLKQAAFYVGMGKQRLVSLAREGTVKGFQDMGNKRRDWIFDRYSLDAYREGQAIEANYPIEIRVKEIIRKMRS